MQYRQQKDDDVGVRIKQWEQIMVWLRKWYLLYASFWESMRENLAVSFEKYLHKFVVQWTIGGLVRYG